MMVAKEHTRTLPKRTWLVVSVLLHGIIIVALLTSLMEKHLLDHSFLPAIQRPENTDEKQTAAQEKEKEKEEEEKRKQYVPLPSDKPSTENLDKAFTVPAPVVFYGNQAMMNLPVPIAGDPDGKSAFDSSPTALPTPPTATISPERISAPSSTLQSDEADTEPTASLETVEAVQEQETLVEQPTPAAAIPAPELTNNEGFFEKTAPLRLPKEIEEEKVLTVTEQPTSSPLPKSTTPQKKAKKQLTLADLFKNAPTALTALGQAGEPSAKKAGTKGGDAQGSGHQITIKEGDMKYYTLWAKFLNHLNQAARFNRRGKERRITQLMQTGEINYVLHCAITVNTEGKLIDIELLNSSGSKEFDRLCVSDIKSAIPYPPLPDSLAKKTARFEVNVYP